jgi:hypothetical protein
MNSPHTIQNPSRREFLRTGTAAVAGSVVVSRIGPRGRGEIAVPGRASTAAVTRPTSSSCSNCTAAPWGRFSRSTKTGWAGRSYAARRSRQESNDMTTYLITGKTTAKGASQFEVDMKYGQMRVWKLEREGDALQ